VLETPVIQSPTATGLYLYAIVDASDIVPDLIGIDEQPVFALTQNNVAALVGNLRSTRLRPERRNVMAHQKVLASVNNGRGILPMRFGVVMNDEEEISRILETHETNLSEQLDRVRGRIELGLRIAWKPDEVFQHLLQHYPALKQLRDSVPRSREGAIEVGKRVADAMETHRRWQEQMIREMFGDRVVEYCFNAPKNDAQLINAACLIERGCRADFESAVEQLAGTLDDTYSIEFNGPWAPHNFIRLNLAF